MLRFKTDQTLPAEIAAQARVTGRSVQMQAHDAQEVETLLRGLREQGVRVEDLEIGRADLEDVFLEIMQNPAQAEAQRAVALQTTQASTEAAA
jgi:ABC-2 type transport system ATP-binding protein